MSDVSATDSGCTRTNPCRSFASALTQLAGRKHIVLAPGSYPTRQTFFEVDLFIHGHGAIVPHATTSTNATMEILRPMTIRGLTFSDSGAALAHVRVGSAASTVVFQDVRFSSAKRLRVEGATILRNAKFSASTDPVAAIVVESTGELTIEGAEIERGVVGIQAAGIGAKVHIKNLMVRGTSARGLELQNATGELEFATVAGVGASVTNSPCAVTCTPNLRVTASIIWQETCSGNIRDAAGACTFQSSIVSNAAAPGITNIDPRFVNAAGGDFHISMSSPAKDALDAGPALDFEGDTRPGGLKFDIGADEAP